MHIKLLNNENIIVERNLQQKNMKFTTAVEFKNMTQYIQMAKQVQKM